MQPRAPPPHRTATVLRRRNTNPDAVVRRGSVAAPLVASVVLYLSAHLKRRLLSLFAAPRTREKLPIAIIVIIVITISVRHLFLSYYSALPVIIILIYLNTLKLPIVTIFLVRLLFFTTVALVFLLCWFTLYTPVVIALVHLCTPVFISLTNLFSLVFINLA